MNKHRKKIILSEIEYWKRNNLLPAHYCDFLSTLYMGGEEDEKEVSNKSSSILYKEKRNKLLVLSAVIGFSIVIAAFIYFMNDFSALLFGTVGVVLLLLYASTKSVKKSSYLPFVYIASAFLLLLTSLKLWSLYFLDQPFILIGLLILNCVMWLFTGLFLKLLYFTLSGSFGLIAIIFFIFFRF